MILGVGNDIVSVSRVKSAAVNSTGKIFSRILSSSELDACKNFESDKRIFFLAKRYAAKESFAKSIGLGIGRGLNFNDIVIKNDDKGKPYVFKSDDLINLITNHFGCEEFSIHLSISDERDYASAFCIIEKIG